MAKKTKKTKEVSLPELTVTSTLEIREMQLQELGIRSQVTEHQRQGQILQNTYFTVKQDLHNLFEKYYIKGYKLDPNTLKYTKEEPANVKTG